MNSETMSSTLNKMVNHKHLRKMLIKKADDYIYKNMVTEDNQDLERVKLKRYQFLSAMLYCIVKNVNKGNVSPEIVRKIINVLVENNFIRQGRTYTQAMEEFEKEYGAPPPTFIVFSPTQVCNLRCIGCYASSEANKQVTVPYHYVDKVIGETFERWGSRFVTISGGEPFMYKSEGKTLLDIFQKYNEMFFLVYTNGTQINEETAARLAKSANVTPAISVEGFEEQTDQRRGAGIHKKILKAFERLRQAGVPFGISVTATRKNVDLLLEDEFYDFYFAEQGACYMWEFQLMPIGRGKDELDLMVRPDERIQLYRKWEQMLSEKKYCIADFWNSGVLSSGCIICC